MYTLNDRKWSLLTLVVLSIASGDALAQDGPSFNCARAKNDTEKTLCSNPSLAIQDRQVSKIYATRLRQVRTDATARRTTMRRQRNFIKQRNLCRTNIACLNNLYEMRFYDLANCIMITNGNQMNPPAPRPVSVPNASVANPAPDCSSAYKVDPSFLSVSEGGLWLDGYVPGYHMEDHKNPGHIDKKRHHNTPDSNSGVTIGKGIDLAQQSPQQIRKDFENYIKAYGNLGNGDFELIITKLAPYMDKRIKGWSAVRRIELQPISLTKEQADLLTRAVEFRFVRAVETQFDRKNNLGTTFKQLPAEAQTTLLDFSYNYGSSDSMGRRHKNGRGATPQDRTRTLLWSSYYNGRWQDLATKLQTFDVPDNRKIYKNRRHREGKLLQKAIDKKRLPDKGNPCAPRDAMRSALIERHYRYARHFERSLWS